MPDAPPAPAEREPHGRGRPVARAAARAREPIAGSLVVIATTGDRAMLKLASHAFLFGFVLVYALG